MCLIFMKQICSIRWVALVVALSGVVGVAGAARFPAPSTSAPHLVLWAWERPESLLFAEDSGTGVAFLAESIFLEQHPVLRPRFQPLKVAPGTSLIAVVRLESTTRTPSIF